MRLHKACLLVLGAVLIAGCKASPPKLVPVAGKVVYRGAPLAFTTVQFNPVGEVDKNSPFVNATSAEDGTFRLQSYPYGDGAIPGRYKVYVTTYPGGPSVPERYRSLETTPLEVVIPEQGDEGLILTLKD